VNLGKYIGRTILGLVLLWVLQGQAQDPTSRFRSMGGGKNSGKDTALKHRTGMEDSITISFRFMDSSRLRKFDSSVTDFYKKYPVPASYIDLGNFGNAAKDLVFNPRMNPGWDPGWHSYDIYTFTVDETRFYTTTRPYSELGYLLGGHAEQMINLVHTQNIKPNWNFALQYRLINSPGIFQNQNTNHNNYRFSSWYQSRNKRYQAFLVLVASKIESSENGGLRNASDLDSIAYTNRSTVPTQLGPNSLYNTNFFSANISTGTIYSKGTYLLRQQYDFIGKKDSIVTDSTVIPLFYPRFRAEHTIQYSNYNYRFTDQNPDSSFYIHNYNFISTPDTFGLKDYWRQLINDLSVYQFPYVKNPQQFIKVGISLENLWGYFDAGSLTFYNVFVHGEYRNRTRNQKWDVEANGKFYLNGTDAGDYSAFLSLKRLISSQLGSLEIGFRNVNQTPSFAFSSESSFGFGVPAGNFKKENTTNLFGFLEEPKLGLKLGASYYLLNNYSYFYNYYQASQQSSLFSILQITGEKQFILHRNWIWHLSVILQQKTGPSPINMPLLLALNQIGYEGKLGYKNLNISFGAELRYYTPYSADGYSPLTGQFFAQNSTTISQQLPDINAYVHLRIRSFTGYARAENLNTLQINSNGIGFTNYNFVAPGYPSTGLRLRLGIFWGFVN
jgi:hypothetical protein